MKLKIKNRHAKEKTVKIICHSIPKRFVLTKNLSKLLVKSRRKKSKFKKNRQKIYVMFPKNPRKISE
jgi:hypothetical protein